MGVRGSRLTSAIRLYLRGVNRPGPQHRPGPTRTAISFCRRCCSPMDGWCRCVSYPKFRLTPHDQQELLVLVSGDRDLLAALLRQLPHRRGGHARRATQGPPRRPRWPSPSAPPPGGILGPTRPQIQQRAKRPRPATSPQRRGHRHLARRGAVRAARVRVRLPTRGREDAAHPLSSTFFWNDLEDSFSDTRRASFGECE